MNNRDQEKLLKEILPSDDVADFRKATLEHGLAGLRREQRRRRVVRLGAAVVILVSVTFGVFYNARNQSQKDHGVTQASSQPAGPGLASSHVEFISDEQLLSLFTNQPVALIGKPGDQRLVFLGKSEQVPVQN